MVCMTPPCASERHGSPPITSLIALAKSRPGYLNFAVGGVPSHLTAELLRSSADIKVTFVPYKGAGPAFSDLVAGQVQAMLGTVSTVLPFVQAGRMRALAVTSVERAPLLPNLPTVAQTLPGYDVTSFSGFGAPRGTPPEIVAQLQAEVVRITNLPETKERLTAVGFETVGGTSEAFAALIKNDLARLGKVIRDANIRAE